MSRTGAVTSAHNIQKCVARCGLEVSKLSLELKPGTSETDIAYVMDFTLYGRLASLGNSVIKRKAEEMRQEFTRRILAELETSAP